MLTTRYSMLATFRSGLAAERDFDRLGVEALREHAVQILQDRGRQIDVVGPAGLFVVKMRVWSEIRAITRRTALEVHRADEVTVNQRLEAVVDGSQGNGGKLGLNAYKNLVGGRVVAFVKQHVVNNLALRGGAEAAVGEPLGERFRVFGCRHAFEGGSTNWNDSKAQARIRIILSQRVR